MNSYKLAATVHSEVNASVRYKSDQAQYGVPDRWEPARPGGFEDCDGYALAKRKRLLDAGWPVDKQALIICTTPEGTCHMVLMVDTDAGIYILDNMEDAPIPPSNLNYKWVGILWGKSWRHLRGFWPN